MYEGNKPYIFISYAHEDKDVVFPIVNELIKNRFRVWYDPKIHPADEWPEEVGTHLINSKLVIVMMSDNYNASVNCRRELYLASDEKIEMFLIYLKNVEISAGFKLSTAGSNSILYYKMGTDEFHEKLIHDEKLNSLDLRMSKEEFNSSNIEYAHEESFIPSVTIAIGVLKHRNCVLMLKRRVDDKGVTWGFPATFIRNTDDIEKRIVKETKAETGITTNFVKHLGKRIHPDTHTITYYCQLEYVDGILENLDDDENEEAKWVPLINYKTYITSDLFSQVEQYLEEDIKVAVAIVINNGKIAIVHRKKAIDTLGYVFPGGNVEADESILEAAERELKEETGLIAKSQKVIGQRIL